FVAGIEILDVVGVATVEERGAGKSGVGVLTGHARVLRLGQAGFHPRSRVCGSGSDGPASANPYTIYAASALSQSSSYESRITNPGLRQTKRAACTQAAPFVAGN